MKMPKIIKRPFCDHTHIHWIRNVYGDEINARSSYKRLVRSIWECDDCGKTIYSSHLRMNHKNVLYPYIETEEGE